MLSEATIFADKQKVVAEEEDSESLPVITLQKTDRNWTVIKEKKRFVITGEKIERFAKRTDFDNPAGVDRLRDIMRKMGLLHELDRAGLEPDDLIVFGADGEFGQFRY